MSAWVTCLARGGDALPEAEVADEVDQQQTEGDVPADAAQVADALAQVDAQHAAAASGRGGRAVGGGRRRRSGGVDRGRRWAVDGGWWTGGDEERAHRAGGGFKGEALL